MLKESVKSEAAFVNPMPRLVVIDLLGEMRHPVPIFKEADVDVPLVECVPRLHLYLYFVE